MEVLSTQHDSSQPLRIKNKYNVLSNFYGRDNRRKPLFMLDGLQWRTVEHFFQAAKFKWRYDQYYYSFSLDSGSALSRASGAAALSAGRLGRMSPDDLEAWNNGGSRRILIVARDAKFRQNDDLCDALVLTSGSELYHRAIRGGDTVLDIDLMALRDNLVDEKNGGVRWTGP